MGGFPLISYNKMSLISYYGIPGFLYSNGDFARFQAVSTVPTHRNKMGKFKLCVAKKIKKTISWLMQSKDRMYIFF